MLKRQEVEVELEAADFSVQLMVQEAQEEAQEALILVLEVQELLDVVAAGQLLEEEEGAWVDHQPHLILQEEGLAVSEEQ